MIRQIHIIDFKAFSTLRNLRCEPLTLLTGVNSTGKSTVLQALLLLRQSAQQGLLQQGKLALNGDLAQLGTAKDVLNERKHTGCLHTIRLPTCWRSAVRFQSPTCSTSRCLMIAFITCVRIGWDHELTSRSPSIRSGNTGRSALAVSMLPIILQSSGTSRSPLPCIGRIARRLPASCAIWWKPGSRSSALVCDCD